MRSGLDSGTGSTCGQIGGDVIATKERQSISALCTETPNTPSASEVWPQSHTAGRMYGKVARRRRRKEDSDGGRKKEQREQMMGDKDGGGERKEKNCDEERSEVAKDKQGTDAKLW